MPCRSAGTIQVTAVALRPRAAPLRATVPRAGAAVAQALPPKAHATRNLAGSWSSLRRRTASPRRFGRRGGHFFLIGNGGLDGLDQGDDDEDLDDHTLG